MHPKDHLGMVALVHDQHRRRGEQEEGVGHEVEEDLVDQDQDLVLGNLCLPSLLVPIIDPIGPAVGADLGHCEEDGAAHREAGLLLHLPGLLLHQGHTAHQEDRLDHGNPTPHLGPTNQQPLHLPDQHDSNEGLPASGAEVDDGVPSDGLLEEFLLVGPRPEAGQLLRVQLWWVSSSRHPGSAAPWGVRRPADFCVRCFTTVWAAGRLHRPASTNNQLGVPQKLDDY